MTRYAVWFLVLSLLAACGGDDDGGPPRYVIEIEGVPGSRPVAALGDGAQRDLCSSYDAYVETYIDVGAVAHFACLPQALVLGGSQAGCEQRLDECTEVFPEPVEVRASADGDAFCFEELSQCEATVAELQGCINVNLDLLFEILDDWSCALYGDEDVAARAERMMSGIEICADLDASCNRFANTLGPD